MSGSLDPRTHAGAPLVLRFDDNALLSQLYGEYDHNLIRIEQEIGVHVNSRGNEVAITGPKDQVGIARDVLTGLYDQLKRGLPVDRGEVDGVIRMACETYRAGLEPDTATPEIVKTPRRHIQARSLTQAAYLRAQREERVGDRNRPGGHRQDLPRGRDRRLDAGFGHDRPDHSVAPRGRGRRAAGLPARRPEGKGRSLSSARSTTRCTI